MKAVPKEVLEKSILPLIPVRRLGEPEEIGTMRGFPRR
jgi:acetoacetyl-CoA reductase